VIIGPIYASFDAYHSVTQPLLTVNTFTVAHEKAYSRKLQN